jgi:predicted nucleic acid-binding protein
MMAGIVLDASTTLAWAFDDESGNYIEDVLQFVVENHAVVPALWNYEIANGVLVGLRRERLSVDEAVTFARDLAAMDIRVDSVQCEPMTLLAEAVDSGLTAYDASYLMLARTTGLPLATRDKALIRAARHSGVDIF